MVSTWFYYVSLLTWFYCGMDTELLSYDRMCSTWPQPLQATNLGKSAMARCCREWRLWRLLVTLSASLQAGEFMSCEIVVDFERRWISLKKLVAKCGTMWPTSRKMICAEVGGTRWRSQLLARSLLGVKTNKDRVGPIQSLARTEANLSMSRDDHTVSIWPGEFIVYVEESKSMDRTFAQKKHDKTPLWCLSVSFTHWFCLPGWRKMVVRHPPPGQLGDGSTETRRSPVHVCSGGSAVGAGWLHSCAALTTGEDGFHKL
jgi:hypothetical protein